MLIFNKIKKVLIASSLALFLLTSPAKADCMPLNPICIFQKLLKLCPGIPTLDGISVPGAIGDMVPVVVDTLQTKGKELIDKAIQQLRSGQLPSLAKLEFKKPNFGGMIPASNEEYSTLDAFPQMDSEDPKEIAKAIEVIFLRPGYQDQDSKVSLYDSAVMTYYAQKFGFNSVVEIMGFVEFIANKMEEFMTAAEDIQKQIESADDSNKAQRANYAANLMEYQLMIIQNQIEAAFLQMDAASKLANGFVLSKPIFGNM